MTTQQLKVNSGLAPEEENEGSWCGGVGYLGRENAISCEDETTLQLPSYRVFKQERVFTPLGTRRLTNERTRALLLRRSMGCSLREARCGSGLRLK